MTSQPLVPSRARGYLCVWATCETKSRRAYLSRAPAEVNGQGHSDSIYMWWITTSRVLPLIIAFEVQALANRERRAERIGVLAPCAGLAVVIDFSPRIG